MKKNKDSMIATARAFFKGTTRCNNNIQLTTNNYDPPMLG